VKGYGKLKALFVTRVAGGSVKAGKYIDGGGLYLVVAPGGTASWVFRYERDGKRTYMGLGSLRAMGLADARAMADASRRTLAAGDDPIIERDRLALEAKIKASQSVTFKEASETFLKNRPESRNAKHNKQWRSTLESYAYPKIGAVPISQVGKSHMIEILEPIWKAKHPTARKVRGRIEAVLDAAAARGLRDDNNPARPQAMKAALGVARKPQAHHASMPWKSLPSFVKALRRRTEELGALALEFTILTAARTTEAIEARWDEIDLANARWIVPAERMKSHREHRVPLSPRALQILDQLAQVRHSSFIFPGRRGDRPASNMMMAMVIRNMAPDYTVHGFRSSFRDWCGETGKPRELAEAALAHVVAGVEGAYFRSDLFDLRRTLMAEWARAISPR